MNKVINIEDKGVKFVLLGSGTYLIDGKIVNVDGCNKSKVKVIDETNIKKVSEDSIIIYYLNTEDESKLSEFEYNNKVRELLKSKSYKDEYDEYGEWDSLESEFGYRKFKETYKPIRKIIQTFSKPLKVELVNINDSTNNKFIKNCFLNGGSVFDLYEYNQNDAWLNIVSECFNEFKMQFVGNVYHANTKDKKVWGNSEHSCIRYVTAFGSYIFDDRFKNPCLLRGTLGEMNSRYEHDRNTIRKIIRTKYNSHFGKIDEDKIDFKKILNDLYSLRGNINSIESKKVTWGEQNKSNKKINEIIEYLESKFEG